MDLKNGDHVYVKFAINENVYAKFSSDFRNEPFILGPVNDLQQEK